MNRKCSVAWCTRYATRGGYCDKHNPVYHINTTKRDWAIWILAWALIGTMAAITTWALMAF